MLGLPGPLNFLTQLDSALAENCFKHKMISEPTLPGVFDTDLEPFIDESEG
jgi:hypothetical protein